MGLRIQFCSLFLLTEFLGAVYFVQVMSFWLLLSQDLQQVLRWFAAQCEAAGMRKSTSKSETMVLDWQKGGLPFTRLQESSCLT